VADNLWQKTEARFIVMKNVAGNSIILTKLELEKKKVRRRK
jgi:hypothetical protein